MSRCWRVSVELSWRNFWEMSKRAFSHWLRSQWVFSLLHGFCIIMKILSGELFYGEGRGIRHEGWKWTFHTQSHLESDWTQKKKRQKHIRERLNEWDWRKNSLIVDKSRFNDLIWQHFPKYVRKLFTFIYFHFPLARSHFASRSSFSSITVSFLHSLPSSPLNILNHEHCIFVSFADVEKCWRWKKLNN